MAAKSVQELFGREAAFRKPGEVQTDVRILLSDRRCVHDPRVSVVCHYEAHIRVFDSQFVHIQRVRVFEQSACSRQFPGVDDDRQIVAFRQFKIRIVQRIVQRDRIIARIQLESDAFRFAEFRIEQLQ